MPEKIRRRVAGGGQSWATSSIPAERVIPLNYQMGHKSCLLCCIAKKWPKDLSKVEKHVFKKSLVFSKNNPWKMTNFVHLLQYLLFAPHIMYTFLRKVYPYPFQKWPLCDLWPFTVIMTAPPSGHVCQLHENVKNLEISNFINARSQSDLEWPLVWWVRVRMRVT